jgi:hypothetical protein
MYQDKLQLDKMGEAFMLDPEVKEGLDLFLSLTGTEVPEEFILEGELLKKALEKSRDLAKDKIAPWVVGKYKSPQIRTGAKALSIAALVAGGAYAYHRFLSKAAKKCSGYAGDEKTECMRRVKAGATDSEINELKRSMSLCSQSADPMTCKKRLKDRIGKLSEQLTQLRDGSLLRD